MFGSIALDLNDALSFRVGLERCFGACLGFELINLDLNELILCFAISLDPFELSVRFPLKLSSQVDILLVGVQFPRLLLIS